jgi:hypothetical protein
MEKGEPFQQMAFRQTDTQGEKKKKEKKRRENFELSLTFHTIGP